MKTIYKYILSVEDSQVIMMPIGAKILCVQVQDLKPCLWALVDSNKELKKRVFVTVGTGNPVPEVSGGFDLKYTGTYQMMGGGLVFHLFEIF